MNQHWIPRINFHFQWKDVTSLPLYGHCHCTYIEHERFHTNRHVNKYRLNSTQSIYVPWQFKALAVQRANIRINSHDIQSWMDIENENNPNVPSRELYNFINLCMAIWWLCANLEVHFSIESIEALTHCYLV